MSLEVTIRSMDLAILMTRSPSASMASRPLPHHLPPTTQFCSLQAALTHLNRLRNIRPDRREWGEMRPHELKLVTRSEHGPKGRALEDEFRSMVEGDYGKRCQICSRTFARTGGGWQVNVAHVVPPRMDYRTNHFGDLLGLCGWHFNLLRYGEWTLLDPNTDQPFEDMDGTRGWERMRSFILKRAPKTDDLGNPFVGLPVRFSNALPRVAIRAEVGHRGDSVQHSALEFSVQPPQRIGEVS